MPKVGVEPTLPEENYALNVARLPIPPLRQANNKQYSPSYQDVNIRVARVLSRRRYDQSQQSGYES